MRTFRSDNNAGLCPEAIAALIEANDGSHEIGYGDDSHTARAVAEFKRIFGDETAVFFVASGTAANCLAIASLTQPWQQVLAHAHSHCNADESTAPERFAHCRVTAIHAESGKISPDDLAAAGRYSRGDVHQPQPGVLTVSNATEFGLVYSPSELKALCHAAHELGYRVHVDGARFANAVAARDCDPRDLTIRAGVDAMSFGGTKNGLAYGEAVLFFPQPESPGAYERAVETFAFHRKSTGHLLSKHRFVAAPMAATLKDGAWLRHAGHANAMAAELSAGLAALGVAIRFRTQANAVFACLPPRVDAALQRRGHGYYPFGEPSWNVARLMCSFNTAREDVRAFLADVEAALGQPAAAR